MMTFRHDIQGLRALAVISVIIFHLNSAWLPGGFVGVDIFFVISGFLIYSILSNQKAKKDYRLVNILSNFYISRIKRIAPAYYITLMITTLAAAILFLPSDFQIYKNGLVRAIWFNSNHYFATFGDYFAPATYEQPLLHTWSLAVEIKFYLLAPLIFLFLSPRYLKWLLPIMILILTFYAEYCLRILGQEQATYYSFIARLPAFLVGAWVALLIENKDVKSKNYNLLSILTIIGLVLIIISLILPRPMGYFPGIAGLIPILGVALIIYSQSKDIITKILSFKGIVWVGTISYSLYLWHWPVLALLRYYTGTEILSIKYSVLFTGVTLVLSVLSYYWVEEPLRQKRSRKSYIGYIILIVTFLLTVRGMNILNKHYTPEKLPIEYTRYADAAMICHGQIVGDCFVGDLSSDREVLVLGDSHAAMLNHFFDHLGKELHFKARIITASSCVTIPGFDYMRLEEWARKPCINQIAEAKKYISTANIIFIAASWNWQLKSVDFKQVLNDFMMNLNPTTKLYIIGQEPLLAKNPIRSQRFSNLGLNIQVPLNMDYLMTNLWMKSKMAHQTQNVEYLDLSELALFRTPPNYQGEILYYDEHHLNQVGVVEYAKQAHPIFEKLLGDN